MDMKKLSTEQLVKKSGLSRYSLIAGISKRAREISERNEELGIQTDRKSVVVAAEEFADGDYSIREPEEEDEQ